MTISYGDVPLIDPQTGRFPDAFAPPSVALDAASAAASATSASTSATTAVGALGAAESARDAAASSASGAAASATSAGLSATAAQDAATSATASASTATAMAADAFAALAAMDVEQVTLTGNLAYALPAGVAPNRVHSVVFTQNSTGGHTVTYGGLPVAVESAAGAETLVEFWPNGEVAYPVAAPLLSTFVPYSTLVDDVQVRTAGTKGAAAATPIRFIDADGALIRINSTSLQRSTDNGATWATFATLPRTVSGIRQLDNGELLIGTTENPGVAMAGVWLSSGYPDGPVTFTEKLTAGYTGQTMELAWGFGGGGTTYAVSEYDSKAPGSRSATQRAWITTDSGETWTPIYDHGNGSLSSRHIHGVYADPYRPGTVWLALGDYTGNASGDRRIQVSRDSGATWADVTTDYQPTAIMCFPNVVAFGTDGTPNGVLVIANPDAAPSAMRLSLGYRLNNSTAISHVAERPFRVATADGYLTLLPFSSATSGVNGCVLGSYDGSVWFEVWRDSTTSTGASQGPLTAFGPTRDGRLLIRGKDTAGAFYDAEAPLRTVPGLVSVAANLANALNRLIPRRAFISFNNQSSPYQTMVSNTEATILLHTTPQAIDDPGGLFTRASDGTGIIVNRDAHVRIEASGGKPLSFSGRYDTAVFVNGVDMRRVSDMTISITLRVGAGQKVEVHAQPNGYNGALTGFRALTLEAWETGA